MGRAAVGKRQVPKLSCPASWCVPLIFDFEADRIRDLKFDPKILESNGLTYGAHSGL